MNFIFRRTGYTDIEVVEAYSCGDKRVQQAWYDRCREQFGKGTSNYAALTDYNRDDLFHESFELLWDKIEQKQIYVLNGEVHAISRNGDGLVADLMGYFMRIVKNKYMEMLRSGKYMVPMNETVTASDEDIFDTLYWDEDPEVEKDRIVSRCLQTMPKSCIEILTKFYYEKKSLEQILEERDENTSYDGLKSRKSKCMSNLKKRIIESFAKAGLQ